MASTFEGARDEVATTDRPPLRDTWPLQRGDVLLFIVLFAGLTAVWSGVGWLLTGPLEGSALVRADQDIAEWFVDQRTPARDDWATAGAMLADTFVKIIVTALIAGDHARRLAQLARAGHGRHPLDPRSVGVHHRHLDRRASPARRAEARELAGRQQLPVRAHGRGRRVQCYRRGRLLEDPQRLGACDGHRRRGGRPDHRRGGAHVRRDALPDRRRRRRSCSAWRPCWPCGWCSAARQVPAAT